MGITAPGVGSGLDVQGLVEKLVSAERVPAQKRLSEKATRVSTHLTALGQIKSVLAKFQDSLSKLYNVNEFYKMKVTTSDTEHFNVTTTEKANSGQYNVIVKQLAQRQSLSSSPTSASNLGTGTLTIDFGTYNSDKTTFTNNSDKAPVVINITSGNDSLQNICDTINKSTSSVQANIIQDSQGSRISITSAETGEKMAMKISVTNNSGNALSSLAYDPTTGVNAMTETAKALNSEVMVNGVSLINSTNNLKDAITGITLDLKKAEPDKTVSLGIEQDKTILSSMVRDFVKQFNDSMTALNAMTGYDKETKTADPLRSDDGIRNLKTSLGNLVTSIIPNGDSQISSLVDIGIKTDAKGLLILDDKKFTAALESNYADIGAIFAKTATATDPNIRINKLDKTVKAGTYHIILDSYEEGKSMTGSIGGLKAISSNGTTLKGTGALSQLAVDVLGGNSGPRGSIHVQDGLAVLIGDLFDGYLNDKTGNYSQTTKKLTGQLNSYDKENDALLTRMAALEKRYLRQFNALDAVLASLQKTTGMIDQLGNLPKIQ